jgi:hypothetical protein
MSKGSTDAGRALAAALATVVMMTCGACGGSSDSGSGDSGSSGSSSASSGSGGSGTSSGSDSSSGSASGSSKSSSKGADKNGDKSSDDVRFGAEETGANGQPSCLDFGQEVLKVAERRGHAGLRWEPLRGDLEANPQGVPLRMKKNQKPLVPTTTWFCSGYLLPTKAAYPKRANGYAKIEGRLWLTRASMNVNLPDPFGCGSLGQDLKGSTDPTLPSAESLSALRKRLGKYGAGIGYCRDSPDAIVGGPKAPWMVQVHTTGGSRLADVVTDVGHSGYPAFVVAWLNDIEFDGKSLPAT